MRVIEVRKFGGPEVLQVARREIPVPGPGELVVKVEAVGVNPVETYIRAGTYPVLPDLPYVPGMNAAGLVYRCGEAMDGRSIGDRVYVFGSQSGTYGEYCLCRADQVCDLPEQVSFAEGAALGVPAATAYRAVFIRGAAVAGERVLVHGASGSVGMAAIQLATAAGLEVYGTAGTPEGLTEIRRLGVRQAFDHTGEGYLEEMKTVPGGFALILEMLANINLERDLELLAPQGRVVIIGSRGRIEIDPRMTMGKESDIRGLALASSSSEEMMRTHAALGAALTSGVLRPKISVELPLAQAAQAHARVLESGNCGKIVLRP